MAAYEAAGETDDWYTPRYIFDALGERFDLDVAAPTDGPRHVPASAWFSSDALSLPWRGFVWMNQPFGHQSTKRKWLTKFFAHGHGIALVPDRTSAPWFQEFAPKADAILWVGVETVRFTPAGPAPISRRRFTSALTWRFESSDRGRSAPMVATMYFRLRASLRASFKRRPCSIQYRPQA